MPLLSNRVHQPRLSFDPATQAELDTHKVWGDHDSSYWKLTGNAGTTGTNFPFPGELRGPEVMCSSGPYGI